MKVDVMLFIAGFDTKTLSVTGLEEYWPYKFKVNAVTGRGNETSHSLSVFRTKQARVSIFVVIVFFTNNLYLSSYLGQLPM